MLKHVRGRLYVDKAVQLALVWQLFRQWALFIAILTGMLLALQAFDAGPNQSWRSYLQATWDRNAMLFVVVIVLFPVFAYDSIKLSHRFTGPIMRLRRALQEAALCGHVQPLQFRQDDYWQDMASHFNTLLKRLPEGPSLHNGQEENPARGLELALTGTEEMGVDARRSQPCK